MCRLLHSLFAIALFLTLCTVGFADDWRGFRGTQRDGKSPDTGLLKSWPNNGPELLWKKTDIGVGYSGPSVADGVVYITGMVGDDLALMALDEKTGDVKWKRKHGDGWDERRYAGSRSTPTISQGRVYVLSAKGKIGCYKAEDGTPVWNRRMADFAGNVPRWGFAESVLATRNYVAVTPGGKNCIVALSCKDGKPVWRSRANGGKAHYGSLILFAYEKAYSIVGGNSQGLFSIDPRNGNTQWTVDFATNNTANCPTPAFSDGYVFWANGYGKGGVCVKLSVSGSKVGAREVWRTRDMNCHHGGYIIDNGYIYGNNGSGWACLELKSGKVMWKDKGVGKGSIAFADGMLYLFGERGGKVALAEATPDGYKQSGSFSVSGSGESWAHPVIINGHLFLRFGSNLYCFNVKK